LEIQIWLIVKATLKQELHSVPGISVLLQKIRLLLVTGRVGIGNRMKKIKGVDVSSLNKRQQDTMKKHSQHHTKKHMQYMVNSMKRGATFTQAHRAMKKVGK